MYVIEKDTCDYQNVSIKASVCLCVHFVHRSLHFPGKRFLFLFLVFELILLTFTMNFSINKWVSVAYTRERETDFKLTCYLNKNDVMVYVLA